MPHIQSYTCGFAHLQQLLGGGYSFRTGHRFAILRQLRSHFPATMIKVLTVLVVILAVAYTFVWPTAHFILGMGASCAAKTTCSAIFISNRNFSVNDLALVRSRRLNTQPYFWRR
jgi:hypothetical protein